MKCRRHKEGYWRLHHYRSGSVLLKYQRHFTSAQLDLVPVLKQAFVLADPVPIDECPAGGIEIANTNPRGVSRINENRRDTVVSSTFIYPDAGPA